MTDTFVYSHLGYYKVGQKLFNDKLEAILEANNTLADIEWDFYQDVYSKINWLSEPDLSLDQLYKMRAQQIREQYEYVIVLCSGGGDSTNVVYSFLRNGIHIDEIIASAPLSGLDQWSHQAKDNSADNTMSETYYAQLPLIRDIAQEFPNVKITINDYFETMMEFKTDDWLFRCGEWIHPSSGARYNLEKLTHLRNMAEAGKKIGIVYGIDKPMLIFDKEDKVRLAMADRTVNVQRPAFEKNYPNVQNVLFYFTPDMPMMQVKQAHSLAKWLFLPGNEKALKNVLNLKNPPENYTANRIRNSTYERAIIPCIYPGTYKPVFQGHKPTRMFLGEHDGWFYKLHGNTRMYEMIDSDFRNFYSAINDKYFNENKSGFKPYSQSYVIGDISNFKPAPSIIL
jgi:hypothetical protein